MSRLRSGIIVSILLAISSDLLAETDLEKATRLIKERNFKESQLLLDRIVKTEPRNAEAWYQLALLQWATSHPQKVVDYADKAIAINPRRASYHLLRGRSLGNLAQNANMFRAVGLARDAREAFEKAVELEPGNRDAVFALFDFYINVPSVAGGSLDEADALADRTQAVDPALGHYLKGRVLQKKEEPGAARTEYRAAIEADPRFSRAYNELGYVELRMNQVDMALTHFRKQVELDPGNANCYDSLGDGWMAKPNLGEAINAYRQALALNPLLFQSLRSLGNALEQAGRRDEAIAHYRKCAKLGAEKGIPQLVRESKQRLNALGVKD
jgi:tetratricopeptide (TPR) repeat protein